MVTIITPTGQLFLCKLLGILVPSTLKTIDVIAIALDYSPQTDFKTLLLLPSMWRNQTRTDLESLSLLVSFLGATRCYTHYQIRKVTIPDMDYLSEGRPENTFLLVQHSESN